MDGKRISGSGNLARVAVIPVWVLLAVAIFGSTTHRISLYGGSEGTTVLMLLAISMLIPIGRALCLGIWLTPDAVVVRSWLYTKRFELAGDLRCEVTEYFGWLTNFSTFGTGFWLRSLRFTTEASSRGANGLLAGRLSAERQAREINDHIRRTFPETAGQRPQLAREGYRNSDRKRRTAGSELDRHQ